MTYVFVVRRMRSKWEVKLYEAGGVAVAEPIERLPPLNTRELAMTQIDLRKMRDARLRDALVIVLE